MTVPSNRPAIGGKVTRKTEEKRTSALDEGVSLTIEGEVFEVRLGDITAAIARELRRETGRGFNALLETVSTDPDVDTVAEFVWLARRVRGEEVELADVEFTYAMLLSDGFDITQAGAEEVDDSPET